MLIIESVTSNSTRLSPFDVSMASCLSVILVVTGVGDSGKDADYRNYDHDFDQGEAGLNRFHQVLHGCCWLSLVRIGSAPALAPEAGRVRIDGDALQARAVFKRAVGAL